MDQKHYKEYLKQLLDAGISKTRIQKECDISTFTMDWILKNNIEPTAKTKRKICEWYDKIVSRFISLEEKDATKDGRKDETMYTMWKK